jgi:cytochrome P450
MMTPSKEGLVSLPSGVFDPSVLSRPYTWSDPYPVFRHMQEYAPVCFSAEMGGWLLTRYDDVAAAFHDTRLSSRRSTALSTRLTCIDANGIATLQRHLACWALLMDAPDHTRLRGLINRAFSTAMVERMRPRLQKLVDRLLDRVDADEAFDVMVALAIPLPVTVIGDLLGLPSADYERLRQWSNALARFFGSNVDADVFQYAISAIRELEAYFGYVIDRRRSEPSDDLVSALVAAEDNGRMTDQELKSTCVLLLFGGHETTTNLIGNGIYTLMKHPDERERFIRDPGVRSVGIEELLRFESPVQWQSRIASADIEMRGQLISKGSRVLLMLGAANRDPTQFEHSDRLDVGRAPNRHLAMGHGSHYCVGASLGRAEAQLAISSIFERFPNLRSVRPTAEWSENPILRGLKTLPVAATIG